MGRMSRTKGANAERELAGIFTALGLPAERTARQGGMVVHGDLALGTDELSVEVKRHERWDVPGWLAQAHEQAPVGAVPVLAFRRSKQHPKDSHPAARWHVALPVEDFLRLYLAGSPGGTELDRLRVSYARWQREHGRSLEEIADALGVPVSELPNMLGGV